MVNIMSFKKQLIFILALILLLVGSACDRMVPFGPGPQDFTADLHNGYILSRSSNDGIFLNKHENGISQNIIPAKVAELGVNEDYIIAKQYTVSEKRRDDGSFIDKSKPNYWIISLKTQAVSGPLNEETYLKERLKLSIPDSLKLADSESYRSKNH